MSKSNLISPIENLGTEVEIKIKVDETNFIHLQKWLNNNAEYLSEIVQEDYYFNNPDNSWFKMHEEGYKYALKYLRIRVTDRGSSICYKDWNTSENDGKSGLFCKDLEMPIPNTEKYILLLESIGFTEKTKIKKSRKSYIYKDFLIDVDTVKNVGTFIEFEVNNKIHDNPKAEYKRLENFIKNLGLTNFTIQKQGFIILAWNPNFNFT